MASRLSGSAAQNFAALQKVAAALAGMRTYDFALQPQHPDDWIPVPSRVLEEHELHELGEWLWSMNSGRWNILTHYTPALRQLVYFEKARDAVAFKLAWGGQA